MESAGCETDKTLLSRLLKYSSITMKQKLIVFKEDAQDKEKNVAMQPKNSLFPLRLCCLFIFFFQQQITEAVLKIKVLEFLVLVKKKKKKSAQNLNDSTK